MRFRSKMFQNRMQLGTQWKSLIHTLSRLYKNGHKVPKRNREKGKYRKTKIKREENTVGGRVN